MSVVALGPSTLPQHLKVSGWCTWLPLSSLAAGGWMTLLLFMNYFLLIVLIIGRQTLYLESSPISNWKSKIVLLNEWNFWYGLIFLRRFFLWFFLPKSRVIFNRKPEKTMKKNSNVVKSLFIIKKKFWYIIYDENSFLLEYIVL